MKLFRQYIWHRRIKKIIELLCCRKTLTPRLSQSIHRRLSLWNEFPSPIFLTKIVRNSKKLYSINTAVKCYGKVVTACDNFFFLKSTKNRPNESLRVKYREVFEITEKMRFVDFWHHTAQRWLVSVSHFLRSLSRLSRFRDDRCMTKIEPLRFQITNI